jgi:hypothetical protein
MYAYKIKINWKLIFKTSCLLILCFLPYLYYKNHFYEPSIQIAKTFFNQDYSAIGLIKSAFLTNLLFRINQGTSLYEYYSFPKYFASLHFLMTCISFYGLSIVTFWNLGKKGLESCKKKIFLLLAFYIPGIIYEIMNPPTGWHFWHYFIFIVPAILIKGRFIYLIFHLIKQKSFRFFAFSFTQCLLLFTAILLFKHVTNINHYTSTKIRNGNFNNAKALKFFMKDLMNQLKLSPEEFHKNVYVGGISAESKYFLKLSNKNATHDREKSLEGNQCYYMFQVPKELPGNPNINKIEQQKLILFLSDPTINLSTSSSYELVFKKNKKVKLFLVYPYSTKFEQPCYSNQFNRFLVAPKTREYIKGSYNINKGDDKNPVWKIISNGVQYDSNSTLKKLNQTSIFFDNKLNTPIQIETKLENKSNLWHLKSSLIFYSWPLPLESKFQIKEVNLTIFNKNNNKVSFQILDPKSWITSPLNNKTADNFTWSRAFQLKLPFALKKDQFDLNLTIKYFYPQNKASCCKKISLNIPIEKSL